SGPSRHEVRVIEGQASRSSAPVGEQGLVVGRSADADLFVDVAHASRRHARLSVQAGAFLVEDLGSINGTFVNGRKITEPTVLHGGDRIFVGGALLEAVFRGEAPPERSSGRADDPDQTLRAPQHGPAAGDRPLARVTARSARAAAGV